MTPPNTTGAQALSDEQIIERCKAAGIKWIAPDLENDPPSEGGFPGSFDMVTMAEMRSLLDGREQAGAVAVLRFERGTPGRENDMPRVVSCNWQPDGEYSVYLAAPGAAIAAREQEATAKLYAECRQCDGCDHIGINDSNDTASACNSCDWRGPYQSEDKCPQCERTGTMTSACPECGDRYRFLADTNLPIPASREEAPAASAVPLEALKWCAAALQALVDSRGESGAISMVVSGEKKSLEEVLDMADLALAASTVPEQSAKGLTMGGEDAK